MENTLNRNDIGSFKASLRTAILFFALVFSLPAFSHAIPGVPRGIPGDDWADLILGQFDFSQITQGKATKSTLSLTGNNVDGVWYSGSVMVDANNQRLYVSEGSNSRILVVNLNGLTNGQGAYAVIGQPDFTGTACNLDSGFQTFPVPPVPNNSCLCSNLYNVDTEREHGTAENMAVDPQGNLYFPDLFNNRVLRFNKSDIDAFVLGTAVPAAYVWGQGNTRSNFSGQFPNNGGGYDNQGNYTAGSPDNCHLFLSGAAGFYETTGVAIDNQGNLWVTDVANNRVLRFPADGSGVPQATADLVLGQPGFSTGNYPTGPTDTHTLYKPSAVRVDAAGNVYVTDLQAQPAIAGQVTSQGRLCVFQPPLSNGMQISLIKTQYAAPSGTVQFGRPSGLEWDRSDPASGALWLTDGMYNEILQFIPQFSGATMTDLTVAKVLFKASPDNSIGCASGTTGGDNPANSFTDHYGNVDNATYFSCEARGSVGVDSSGNVFAVNGFETDVFRFPAPIPPLGSLAVGVAHSADRHVFTPWVFNHNNSLSTDSLYDGFGVAVASGLDGARKFFRQIVATDGRLIFWNIPNGVSADITSNGKPADGVVDTPDPLNPSLVQNFSYGRVRNDQGTPTSHLWAVYGAQPVQIVAFDLPLASGSTPSHTLLTNTIPILGSTLKMTWTKADSIAPSMDGNVSYLWVAAPQENRVFRIRDPLGHSGGPVVDMILGQRNATSLGCNQTGYGYPFILTAPGGGYCAQCNVAPSRESLYFPGSVRLDHAGNLYISDNALECWGNNRLLRYNANVIQNNSLTRTIYAGQINTSGVLVQASYVYNRNNSFTARNPVDPAGIQAPFEVSFTSNDSAMVIPTNFQGNHSFFPAILQNPLAGDGPLDHLKDYGSVPLTSDFDDQDNLYVIDQDRNTLHVYFQPTKNFSIQAENACSFNGTVQTSLPGFMGTGYVDWTTTVGLNLTLAVNSPSNQTVGLVVRYANPNGPAQTLSVTRGTSVSYLTLPPTSPSFPWGTATVNVSFAAGNNDLKIAPVGSGISGELDLDQFTFSDPTVNLGICTTDLQAENACSFNGTVQTSLPGFMGTGYVDWATTAGLNMTLALNAAANESLPLVFRYSNPNGPTRIIRITRGTSISYLVLLRTTAANPWRTATVTVSLAAGNNLLQLSPQGAGSAGELDLDQVSFTSSTVSPGTCPVTNPPTNTPTNSPTPSPSNTPTNTPTITPTKTPTNSPTDSPTLTPTSTPTPTPDCCSGLTSLTGLNQPEGMVIDYGLNILYVADTGNGVVRIYGSQPPFTPAGTLPSWTGGALVAPTDAAVDSDGYVYVSDPSLGTVEKFTPGGTAHMATIGSGVVGLARGVWVQGSNSSNMVFVSTGSGVIYQFNGVGASYPAAPSATYGGSSVLNAPTGLTSVGNQLYVTDSSNNRVVAFTITASNAVINTSAVPVASTVGLGSPRGIRTDLAQNFYVTETDTGEYKFNPSFASPQFCGIPNNAWGIAVNLGGNIIVSQINGAAATILKGCATEPTPTPTPNCCQGAGSLANLNQPEGMVIDYGRNRVYVADTGNHVVRTYGSTPIFSPGVVISTWTAPTAGQLNGPTDTALDTDGNLYVSDTTNGSVEKFSPALVHVATIGAAELSGQVVRGVWVDGSDASGTVYVSTGAGVIMRFTGGGTSYTQALPSWGGGSLSAPTGMMEANRFLYVADSSDNRIVSFDTTSTLPGGPPAVPIASTVGLGSPRGIRTDLAGDVYVTETDTGEYRLDSTFNNPQFCPIPGNAWGIAVNQDGNILVSEIGGGSVTILRGCTVEPAPVPGSVTGKIAGVLRRLLTGGDHATPTSTPSPTYTPTITPTPTATPGFSTLAQARPNISRNGSPIRFWVNLKGAGRITLTLFNLTGEQVYQTTAQGSAGLNSLTWLLQNSAGSPAASGLYVFRVAVFDGRGTASQTGKVALFH